MNRRQALRALAILGIGGTLLAAFLATVVVMRERPPERAPQSGPQLVEPGSVPIGGPFSLVDHRGRPVTEGDFGGRYLLVFFGFTNCPDICPTTLADIVRVTSLLGDDASAVQPLFVSVDPARDTPQRLSEYLKAFDAGIVGLTGTAEQVAAMAEAFRTYYGRQPADADGYYSVDHQANTYLMTPENQYLTHFSYGTSPEVMAKTVREAIAKHGRPKRGSR